MTGTPLAQSPLDIYAQYRFLAPEVFGTNYTNFKNQYANWRLMLNGIPILDKANPYKNLDELHKKMYSCAFRCEAQLDLPPTRDIIVNFDMPTATEKHYHHIKKEGVLRLNGGVVDATHALTLIIREQQMTSGYLPVETDTNIKVEKIDTAREEALKDLLEDFDIEENIVIFARFRKDISNIREVCTSTGRKVFEVSGKENTLKSWDKGVLIVQIGAGAEGIDLTKAHYCIYYTLTHSLSQYQQSRARVHRPNQKHAVTYYILQSKMKRGKTIDTHIYEALQNNEDLIQKIMLGNL
jgi:SNF2 family DNA or RNA helicase